MVGKLKNRLVEFLGIIGYHRINPQEDVARAKLYDSMKGFFKDANSDIISVIFSKDRAMQLDGFLVSYFENVANYSPIIVLYHTSSAEHEASYTDLRSIYKELPVTFIKETNFREQMLSALRVATQGNVIFYVDDMLFSRRLDYNWLKDVDPLKDIVALSRGKDLNYSTVLSKKLQMPAYSRINDNLYCFRWDEVKEFSDWSYPLGVSGYMFSRREILAMMEAVQFKAPNSLESNLQVFLPYFMHRGGVSLQDVATPCVHTNLTQTEGYNNVLGHYSLEELLSLWEEGKRINYSEFMNLPVTEAEVKKYSFIER